MLQPGILALLLGSGLGTVLLAAAVVPAVRIIRHWDLASGSEEQLRLERQTYLVAAIMRLVMGFQIVFLFLFLQTVDGLAPMFIGAMCAAGSLKVNGFGYPALVAKILTCLGWPGVADPRRHRQPGQRLPAHPHEIPAPALHPGAARPRRRCRPCPARPGEPNIITSCCAIVFSAGSGGTVVATVWTCRSASQAAFALSATLTRPPAGPCTGMAGARSCSPWPRPALFAVDHALIAFISLYVYELPTHHCPFCLLHREYGGIGYPLYLLLLTLAVTGLGTGLLHRYRAVPSLRTVIPAMQRRLALIALAANAAFLLLVTGSMALSNLRL